jgi:soluble lytic murein transglycosylase-like protein
MATQRQTADKSETNGYNVNEASRVPALSFAAVVLLFASSLLIGQVVNSPGPKPAKVVASAQTPNLIQREMQREARQKEYDLAARVARFIYRTHGCTDSFAELTAESALEHKLPVRLVAAVVVVESTCRPSVVSSEGAVGLMQIVPKQWHVSRSQLKNPAFNLRKGTEILAQFVRPYGIREGLHHYNGLGVGCAACDSGYADKVLLVAGIKG